MQLVIHPPVEPERFDRITAAAGPMTIVNASDESHALKHMPAADAFFGKITPRLLGAATAADTHAPRTPRFAPRSCPGPRTSERFGQAAHVVDQLGEGAGRRAGSSNYHHLDVGSHLLPNLAVSLANPAPGSVAPGRAAQLAAHREAHATALGRSPEDDEAASLVPAATLEDRLEICRSPEALASRQRQRRRSLRHRGCARR